MSVLHKLSLKSIGALGIVLDCDYCLWLHVSVLARSLGHVGDASGEGSIEFIFNWAYHVRVRIGGLESKIVHWSLQYVGLCKLVFLVIIEINILNYQVIIIILIIFFYFFNKVFLLKYKTLIDHQHDLRITSRILIQK